MDIGACQPLPVRIPVKPTQVLLQVPAAATSNSMSVHIPTFVRRRCTSSIVFGDAGSGEDSLLNFRAPLCPLTMVFAFVTHQTIGTDAVKSRCEADTVLIERSSTVVKAQKIAMGISHYLKLISTPITAIAKMRGARAQLDQRDDQFSDAMGINMEFGFVVNVVPDLFIKLSNVLIGLRRRTLEVRFSGTRSYRSTEPLAAPLGRQTAEFYVTIAHSNHETVEASTMSSALSTHREIHQHRHMRAANANFWFSFHVVNAFEILVLFRWYKVNIAEELLGPLWILQIKASEATVVEISRSHASLYTTWYYSMCDVEVLVNPSGVRGTGSVI
ncbi:hypothetical protein B0H14DRAFT_2653186 [Mycena olivaceomarginata]|nr:hypothetical protein B0H14DRAFT_2653186 [Mycena olivaceomarginata]